MKRVWQEFWPFLALLCALISVTVAGCAGSNGGSSTATSLVATPIQAEVELPTGTTGVNLSTLVAWSSAGEESVSSEGKVKVTIFNGGPQYSELRDSQGHLVMAGFLSSSDTMINAESTARMLGFFAVGGHTLPGNARLVVLDGVDQLPEFAALLSAVEGVIVRLGYLDFSDGALISALNAISDLTINGGGGNPLILPEGRGTLASPSTSASGISLDISKDNELKLTNVYLRRSLVWLDTMSYKLSNGNKVDASAELQNQKSTVINSPQRYAGLVGTVSSLTIAAILGGDLPYSPVTVGPMPIPAVSTGIENCVETTYRLTIGGPGFGTGDVAQLSESRAQELGFHNGKAFLLDYIVPFIATVVVPMNGEQIDDFVKFVGANSALSDLINTMFTTVPAVKDQISKGQYKDALFSLRDGAFLSNSLIPAMLQFFIDFAEASTDESTYEEAAKIAQKGGSVLAVMGAVDKIMSAGETLIVAHDLINSDQANVFTLVSSKGKITLIPDQSTYNITQTAQVRAVIQNKNPDAVYRYDWSIDNGLKLTDGAGRTIEGSAGGTLSSNSDVVSVQVLEQKATTGEVHCTVVRIDGEPDVEVASDDQALAFTLSVPATFEFIEGPSRVTVYVKIPKLEGDYFYGFRAITPEYRLIRDANYNIIGTEFGPGTATYSGNWRHGGAVSAGYVPPVYDGIYWWNSTTYYTFAGETPAQLKAKAVAAHAGVQIVVTIQKAN
jgi:hypothetical protein